MGINDLKELLKPVGAELRSMHSHDESDAWLISDVAFESDEYEKATHVLIGCPQDDGVVRNNGRPGAAEAPDKIREQLYKLQLPSDTGGVLLFDAGNIRTWAGNPEEAGHEHHGGLEHSHASLMQVVKQVLSDGKKVITLGGGNDLSYADVRALSETEGVGSIAAVNLDTHLDMRTAGMMTSGTPYRRLLEEKWLQPGTFHEFGIQPQYNSRNYLKDAKAMGVQVHLLEELLHKGVQKSFSEVMEAIEGRKLFAGLDMDVMQAADAPGVSAASPEGLTTRELSAICRKLHHAENLSIFEITEVNPAYDADNRTVKLAAQCIFKILYG